MIVFFVFVFFFKAEEKEGRKKERKKEREGTLDDEEEEEEEFYGVSREETVDFSYREKTILVQNTHTQRPHKNIKREKKRGKREDDDVASPRCWRSRNSSRNSTAGFHSRRGGDGDGPKGRRERKGRSQSLDVLEEDVRRVADEAKRTTSREHTQVFENIDIVVIIVVVVVISNLQSGEEARLHRWGSRNDWVASPRAIGEKIWRR